MAQCRIEAIGELCCSRKLLLSATLSVGVAGVLSMHSYGRLAGLTTILQFSVGFSGISLGVRVKFPSVLPLAYVSLLNY